MKLILSKTVFLSQLAQQIEHFILSIYSKCFLVCYDSNKVEFVGGFLFIKRKMKNLYFGYKQKIKNGTNIFAASNDSYYTCIVWYNYLNIIIQVWLLIVSPPHKHHNHGLNIEPCFKVSIIGYSIISKLALHIFLCKPPPAKYRGHHFPTRPIPGV